MQQKKKKRDTSSRFRLFVVVSTIGILLLIGIAIPLFAGVDSTEAYATQPWGDPYTTQTLMPWNIADDVCNTPQSTIERDTNNPELFDALEAVDLQVRGTSVVWEVASCDNFDGRQVYSLDTRRIRVRIDDTQNWQSDDEQIGLIVNRVVGALKETDASAEWGDDDMLFVDFIVDGQWGRSWYMNYAEAVRAYEAGLTGLDYYNLGITR